MRKLFKLAVLVFFLSSCLSDGDGEEGSSVMGFTRSMLPMVMRSTVTKSVDEMLPKPTWMRREKLSSWLAVAAVASVASLILAWAHITDADVIVMGTAYGVVFECVSRAVGLAHLEEEHLAGVMVAMALACRFVWRFPLLFMMTLSYATTSLVSPVHRFLQRGGQQRRQVPPQPGRAASLPSRVVPRVAVVLAVSLPAFVAFASCGFFMSFSSEREIIQIDKSQLFNRIKTFTGIDSERSYYDILGISISDNLSSAAIRKAFRDKSRELHPDKNPNDPKAVEHFMMLQEAYDALLKTSPDEQRLRSNGNALKILHKVFVCGLPLMMGFVIQLVKGSLQLIRWCVGKSGPRRGSSVGGNKVARSQFAHHEWSALTQSVVMCELYLTNATNEDVKSSTGDVRRHVTQWLHVLKKAVDYKSKTSFSPSYTSTELNSELQRIRQAALNEQKKILTKLSRQRDGDTGGAANPMTPGGVPPSPSRRLMDEARGVMAKQTFAMVRAGLIHRVKCLEHKRKLANIYLDGHFGNDKRDQDKLDDKLKDLDDFIETFSEEAKRFCESANLEITDEDLFVDEEDFNEPKMRWHFRKELLGKSGGTESGLAWIEKVLASEWFEIDRDYDTFITQRPD